MKNLIARFGSSQGGNVAMLFGLTAIPVLLSVGAAVDYSRAASLASQLQAQTDSITLTLCKGPATATAADMRTQAQNALNGIKELAPVTIQSLDLVQTPRSVTLKTAASYNTGIMKLVGRQTIDFDGSATCSAPETYFEIALVLDTTGSMASSNKIGSARTAGSNFVDYMFTKGALPGHVRMSLVPFAAAVAIPAASRTASWLDRSGTSPIHWQYVSGTGNGKFNDRTAIYSKLKTVNAAWDWQGCVESPPYPYNVNDDAVSTSTPSSLIVPMFAPDEVANYRQYSSWYGSYWADDTSNINSYMNDGTAFGTGSCKADDTLTKRLTQPCKYQTPTQIRIDQPGPNWQCTSRPLSTLGTAQATLQSEIAQLQPSGSTNIHEGFMWGWRTISPTSVFAGQSGPPVAYGTANYQKVIVLMTDGTNQWLSNSNSALGSRYSAYGYFKNADGSDATASNSRFVPGRNNLQTDTHGRTAIDELLATACSNAKAKNIIVYTVGFSTPSDPIDQQGLDLLKGCATAAEYNFTVADGDALIDAFDKISKGIGALRLTR